MSRQWLWTVALAVGLSGTGVALGMSRANAAADPACMRECRAEYNTCRDAARTQARICRSACTDLAAKAREVCAADPASEDCAQARREARACLEECRTEFVNALSLCRRIGQACAGACPPARIVPPPVRDLSCLTGCRERLLACRTRLSEAGAECIAGCNAAAAAAREVCAADPRSEACRRARADAALCVQTCNSRVANAMQGCMTAYQTCVTNCTPVVRPQPEPVRPSR